jgi:glycosyltransferase involved in cell wall biosynthesis
VRILILHSRYLSDAASGENRVVEDEARLLREAGDEVTVLSEEPSVGGRAARLATGLSAVWSRGAAARVADIVRDERVDIVHAHNLFPTLSPAVIRSARAAGAAFVMTLHNFRLMCLPANLLRDGRICEDCVGRTPWPGVVHRCYRGSALGSAVLASSLVVHRAARTFDAVTRFLAVSAFVRDRYVAAGFPPDQVAVKRNFSWPMTPRNGPGDYFLYLGRLSPEKGLDTVLEAWRRSRPSAPLLVVGDGPQAEELRSDAPAGVEFRGRIEPDEVPAVLAGARALLVPSVWFEAAPRSITEAYAAGVPVIASRLGALPEAVVEGVTGRLATPADPASWRAAVGGFDDDTSIRLGRSAYETWRERFSPGVALDGLRAAYGGAVAEVSG